MAVAAPLAVGVISNAEVMDIWLRKWLPPQSVLMMARRELPAGFTLYDTWSVPAGAPALQASVQSARYRCIAVHPLGIAAARDNVKAFMAAQKVMHTFMRGDEERSVDIRPLVGSVMVDSNPDGGCVIEMQVSIGQTGSARPDHLLDLLGFMLPAEEICRTELSFGWPGEAKGGGTDSG